MPGEFDIGAVAQNIGSELFGGGDSPSNDPGNGPSGQQPPSSGAAGGEGAPPPSNPATGKPYPKTWKKDYEPLWQKLDPQLHDYIHQREDEQLRGISMYKQGHERWDSLVSPYKQLLEANQGLDPVKLMQTLMNNHLNIVRGTPEQKRALAQQLLKSYGIELGGAQPPQEVQQLRQEFSTLKQQWDASQQAQYAAEVKSQEKLISDFAADPKNKYFKDLLPEIRQLIQAGLADSLPSAYEQAIWRNPSIRAKYLAEQQEAAAGEDPSKKKAPLNVNGNGEGNPPPGKPKTWQEGVDAIASKYKSTH